MVANTLNEGVECNFFGISISKYSYALICLGTWLFSIWNFWFKISIFGNNFKQTQKSRETLGQTSFIDKDEIKKISLERFRKRGIKKIFYWEFFGQRWYSFGEECWPLRNLLPETGESLVNFWNGLIKCYFYCILIHNYHHFNT